jgi:4-amino-4-deoxy-L-arabinose transferase-like glycosyltransferase
VVLRVWGLGAGGRRGIDAGESDILTRAVTMMKTGDFNPRAYGDPGLAIYLHLPIACGRFLSGVVTGQWRSLQSSNPADFVLWSRGLTAVLGAATVLLLYAVGTRWGHRHALLASALLAVLPSHVRESHYALADVPATFFVTLTLLLSLIAHERGSLRSFAWVGITAGLALSTKYVAGIVVLLPLVAAAMTPRATPSRLRSVFVVLGTTVVAFLLTAPYTILDFPAFLNGLARMLAATHALAINADTRWLDALAEVRRALGWPGIALAAVGLVLASVSAVRGREQVKWALLVLFPLVYFVLTAGRSANIARSLLPMMPFLCLLAAVAVVEGVSLLHRVGLQHAPRRVLTTALLLAVLLPPLVVTITWLQRPSVQ